MNPRLPQLKKFQVSEKRSKQKRKRPAPLSEISGNVPRGFGRSASTKVPKPAPRRPPRTRDSNDSPHIPAALPSYRQDHHSFGEETDSFLSSWPEEPSIRSAHTLGSFPYATFSTTSQEDHRFVVFGLAGNRIYTH
jgi:hypothetical protein